MLQLPIVWLVTWGFIHVDILAWKQLNGHNWCTALKASIQWKSLLFSWVSVCVCSISPCLPGWTVDSYQWASFSGFYLWPGLVRPVATYASLSGPSPQRACGLSSAADTNRIRDDILPGWRGLSWSKWDGVSKDAKLQRVPSKPLLYNCASKACWTHLNVHMH